jgi:hypothetical protein
MAKYHMTWRTREGASAQQNHDDGKSLLAAFTKWQAPADQNWLQFLSSLDGQSGFAVIETDNPAGLLAEVTKFVTWNEFEIVPVIDIVEGVALAAAGVDFRESL